MVSTPSDAERKTLQYENVAISRMVYMKGNNDDDDGEFTFVDLGIDSFLSPAFCNALSRTFTQMGFSGMTLIQHPTVSALVAFICEQQHHEEEKEGEKEKERR